MPSNGESLAGQDNEESLADQNNEDSNHETTQGGITKGSSGSDCLNCKLIGTTFLVLSSGYVFVQGKKWKRKPARIPSVVLALGLLGLGFIRALK